jgi:peptide/nickel transport system permease protein
MRGMEITAKQIRSEAGEESKKRFAFAGFFVRLVREKPLGTVGGIIVLILLITGILANFLAPYGENEMSLRDRLSPPSAGHLLGSDHLGRDLLSRIIYGTRISMSVGLGASLIGTILSAISGTISGYWGGKVDLAIQRFVDGFMCFPPLFLILTVMSMLGPGLVQVIVVLGFLYGIGNTRIIRSSVIDVKENVYVDAAKAIGCSNREVIVRHILPNITASMIILFTVNAGRAIILEATISFLGFGVPPPAPSWGGMLSAEGRRYMLHAPWMVLWPGLALAIVVYGINMLGDAMRDILDPRLIGGLGRYSGKKK